MTVDQDTVSRGRECKPTVLSLFSGIGGFDLGLERAGFEVVGQCEIDPFCNKVLAAHWPEVTRYGDVRAVGIPSGAGWSSEQPEPNAESWQSRQCSISLRRLNLICGGFPCQDLSVAGKRAGLSGARSGLWFEFHRVLSELRPKFCLIENVPGLLSSNSGRDFGVVLAGLGELWPAVGWAILDSQHFGVPQRRQRVYVVGGPTRGSVQQVLSICEGGDWHPQTRRETREDVAGTIAGGAYGAGRRPDNLSDNLVANTLTAPGHRYNMSPDDTYIARSLRADGFDALEDGTGRGTPLTVIQDARGVRDKAQNGIGIQETETMYTLDSVSEHAFQQGATVRRLTPVECERLQGFPDGFTDVDGAKDGPRYKALGNAVSVPVIEYLGLRIKELTR